MAIQRHAKFLERVRTQSKLEERVADLHIKRIARDLSDWETQFHQFHINYQQMEDIRSLRIKPLNKRFVQLSNMYTYCMCDNLSMLIPT